MAGNDIACEGSASPSSGAGRQPASAVFDSTISASSTITRATSAQSVAVDSVRATLRTRTSRSTSRPPSRPRMRTGYPSGRASAASRPARPGSPEVCTTVTGPAPRLVEEEVGMGLQEAAGAELEDGRRDHGGLPRGWRPQVLRGPAARVKRRGRALTASPRLPICGTHRPRASGPAKGVVREQRMANHLHQGDLPDGLDLGPAVAIDCETMGLNPMRDRLCLVQMSGGDGECHLVQVAPGQTEAPEPLPDARRPRRCSSSSTSAASTSPRCDHAFGSLAAPGLLHQDRLQAGADLHRPARAQVPAAGPRRRRHLQAPAAVRLGRGDAARNAQLDYAASDVLYLHRLKAALDVMLAREGRTELAQACFDFLPARARLDLAGWPEVDIFAH